MVARASKLFSMTLADVNWLIPALLPTNYDCCSKVAIEPVVCGNSRCGFSSLEPPLSAACTMTFCHPLIILNPQGGMTGSVSLSAGTCT